MQVLPRPVGSQVGAGLRRIGTLVTLFNPTKGWGWSVGNDGEP